MNWKLISKSNTNQPSSGKYTDWKPLLAKEGYNQCVYCSIHDSRFGGIRNFTVEHYKPKSIFKTLINSIYNLFYACSICNSFKSDDWHDHTYYNDLSVTFYPNPSLIDYSTLFQVETRTGIIEGKFIAAKFLVEKLALNRPQLILDRRYSLLVEKFTEESEEANRQLEKLFTLAEGGNQDALRYIKSLCYLNNEVVQTYRSLTQTSPYTAEQTQRPRR